MLVFYSNRLVCLGSIIVTLIGSALLVGLILLINAMLSGR